MNRFFFCSPFNCLHLPVFSPSQILSSPKYSVLRNVVCNNHPKLPDILIYRSSFIEFQLNEHNHLWLLVNYSNKQSSTPPSPFDCYSFVRLEVTIPVVIVICEIVWRVLFEINISKISHRDLRKLVGGNLFCAVWISRLIIACWSSTRHCWPTMEQVPPSPIRKKLPNNWRRNCRIKKECVGVFSDLVCFLFCSDYRWAKTLGWS